LQTEFNETRGQFSSDGRWVVYTLDESHGQRFLVNTLMKQKVSSPIPVINWTAELKR